MPTSTDRASPRCSERTSDRACLQARDPLEKLQRLGDFRVLCAHRRGPFGVEGVNALAEARLRQAKLIDASHESYVGRPILITRNDYQLGLFNGDVGVISSEVDNPTRIRAYFVGPDGQLLSFSPARLPPHETVFATTVHKAQGSEFDRVALLLPEQVSPILTRELVYTGVTRARKCVDIYGEESVLAAAIGRRIERASGLRQALWNGVD